MTKRAVTYWGQVRADQSGFVHWGSPSVPTKHVHLSSESATPSASIVHGLSLAGGEPSSLLSCDPELSRVVPAKGAMRVR